MRLMIGVVSAGTNVGTTAGPIVADEETMIKSIHLGRVAARHGMVLLTGADPGLPAAATRGAQAAGGMALGLSPAGSREEHERAYHLPIDGFDALLFTGVGRAANLFEVIRAVDILVVVGSGKATLTACALARDLGKLVGVMPIASLAEGEGTRGGEIRETAAALASLFGEAWESDIFLDDDPERLIDRLAHASLTQRLVRPGVYWPQTSAQYATRAMLS